MFFITSDTHGRKHINKLFGLQSKYSLCAVDYIIICGDSGIIFDESNKPISIQLYESLNTNILFIDGNHDNYNLLNNYPVRTWNGGKIHEITPRILHLMRGQVFNICGKSFFTLGGADCLEMETKTEGISWWKDEQITDKNIVESLQNLSAVNFTIDYVITHTCPSDFFPMINDYYVSNNLKVPANIRRKLGTHSSLKLNEIENNINYQKWFFGHLHKDIEIDLKRIALFEKIYVLQ